MGNTHLVTGYYGEEHVSSNDQGSFNAAMMGEGEYVLERGRQFEAQIMSNNLVRVFDGDLMMYGRHCRIMENTYVDVTFDNGTQGYKRMDLIVCKYTKSATTDIEQANFEVIKGTPSESGYIEPEHVTGDILNDRALENDMVMYRVKFDGLTIQPLEKVFETVSSWRTLQNNTILTINRRLNSAVEDAENRVSEAIGELCKLIVNTDEPLVGQTITCTDGGTHTYSAIVPASKTVTFAIPVLGTWTLTNPMTGGTKSVTMKYYGVYETELQCYKRFSAIIDFSMSNPDSMVYYADDAEGMTEASMDWFNQPIFKDLKNILLKDGEVLGTLNKNNVGQYEDGTVADITTLGNDVMTKINRTGYMIKWMDAAQTKLKVSVTDKPDDEEYEYDAFSLDSYNDCDWVAIGKYKGHMNGGKVYSSSGKAVTVSQTIDTFRNACRARGDGYQQRTYGSVKLFQCLFIIFAGTLNSQAAIGTGYVASGHSSGVSTGGTNAYGFMSEIIKASNPTYMTDQNHQVCCLGIEDPWGNYWEFVDGLTSDANRNFMTCDIAANFVTNGSTYENQGRGSVSGDLANYMSKPQGGNKAGFAPQVVSGSDSTYFCDFAYLIASCLALFGGHWDHALSAGVFQLLVNNAFSFSSANVACRLMFMHKEQA